LPPVLFIFYSPFFIYIKFIHKNKQYFFSTWIPAKPVPAKAGAGMTVAVDSRKAWIIYGPRLLQMQGAGHEAVDKPTANGPQRSICGEIGS
jgi:hypothetical protein